jgi:LmbE family N-acetylglucosaminyl deacetylase
LGFTDGMLSNSLYHKLASKITLYLKKLKPDTIITFEPQGVSGHIDHITVSMVSSYVFWKLPFIKNMWQVCRPYDKQRYTMQNYFIYFPKGYRKSEIDKVVNIKDTWDLKVKAMMEHKSQLEDAKRILKFSSKLPKEEYFLVTTK